VLHTQHDTQVPDTQAHHFGTSWSGTSPAW
jgi:hypothetical protein